MLVEGDASSSAPSGNIYLMSYAFNQDCSCFICGTTAGFRVYRTSPFCELRRVEDADAFKEKSFALVAMLYKSNVFTLVPISRDADMSAGANKAMIWDEKERRFVGELRSRHEVKGLVRNREIIVMACERDVYVYETTATGTRAILWIKTTKNTSGLCALACSSTPWIMCCPGESDGGLRVQVGQGEFSEFTAHETALAAVALNDSGTCIATASEYGSVVKVFQREGTQLLYRLRLGTPTHRESVSCITFHPDQPFLAVAASSTNVVQIFKLERSHHMRGDAGDESVTASESKGFLQRLASKATDVVKGAIPDYLTDTSCFARFTIPDVEPDGRSAIDVRHDQARILGPLLAFHRTEPRLTVLHYSGMLFEASYQQSLESPEDTDCGCAAAEMWFAARPDFNMPRPGQQVASESGGGGEESFVAEDWEVV